LERALDSACLVLVLVLVLRACNNHCELVTAIDLPGAELHRVKWTHRRGVQCRQAITVTKPPSVSMPPSEQHPVLVDGSRVLAAGGYIYDFDVRGVSDAYI